MNQIELRRKAIADRFAHSWSQSSTRIPISVKEYRALLDLWEFATKFECCCAGVGCTQDKELKAVLEKLEKGG